ncbi:hypothetical protein HWB57_gp172 [Erwinia phage vB_EamM-Bue1]|uniref:Uncharacterized protein n=1 Tax=Erwinia phage vB_EamM-Bue1 TaxID=2099338 RepID=A0A2P1JUH3_9CAUD|nr:hypothetical protein HWB57_gp172 [Erwinia phage vB_EamM-Bue1]AVO23000.1 hypothetical protein [Erwinia phage vB_EamM-Bue1]
MAKIIPKWRVEPEATGRYRSFSQRGFPSAEYPNGNTCASIRCKDSYHPATHKDATNLDLEVWLAVYRQDTDGWDWRRMKTRAASIAEAKKMVSDYLNGRNRNLVVPAIYRN